MPKSCSTGDNRILHNGNKGKPQVRVARKDGWTAKKRGEFLDHLAATCNVTASARQVGMKEASAYRIRRTDPAFADMWKQAIDAGYDRLRAMLAARAMGTAMVEIGETPMPDIAAMDTDLALRLVELNARRVAGIPKRRGGPVPSRATEEETNAALLKRLKILHKRNQKEAADAEACTEPSECAAAKGPSESKEGLDAGRRDRRSGSLSGAAQ